MFAHTSATIFEGLLCPLLRIILKVAMRCRDFDEHPFAVPAESHNIRWEGRSSGKRSEEALRLAGEHWYLEGSRPPKEKPNPHFAALPTKGELVGRRIKHFWPKMGR
jgi:hypothetical protein